MGGAPLSMGFQRPSTACAYRLDASDEPRGGLGGIRVLRIARPLPAHEGLQPVALVCAIAAKPNGIALLRFTATK